MALLLGYDPEVVLLESFPLRLDHIKEVILAVGGDKGDKEKYCPRVKGKERRKKGGSRQAGGVVLKCCCCS